MQAWIAWWWVALWWIALADVQADRICTQSSGNQLNSNQYRGDRLQLAQTAVYTLAQKKTAKDIPSPPLMSF